MDGIRYTLEQIANIGAAAFFIFVGIIIVALMAGGIMLSWCIVNFADLLSIEENDLHERRR